MVSVADHSEEEVQAEAGKVSQSLCFANAPTATFFKNRRVNEDRQQLRLWLINKFVLSLCRYMLSY